MIGVRGLHVDAVRFCVNVEVFVQSKREVHSGRERRI
ncbi:MAG: hypothetical protein RLZZ232_3646 [Planctomycetota bacterium]|jgi:hypothetical protein